MAVLVAGGAAGVLPAPSVAPCHFEEHFPSYIILLFCCFCVFAAMGVTSTEFGQLEVNLSLSEKRGGTSHLGTILDILPAQSFTFYDQSLHYIITVTNKSQLLQLLTCSFEQLHLASQVRSTFDLLFLCHSTKLDIYMAKQKLL